MGEFRPWFLGWRTVVASICIRKSGVAFNKNQTRSSLLIATWVCVRGLPLKVPSRDELQFRQLQFHCGKPPPAAEPSIFVCIRAGDYSAAEAYELISQFNATSSNCGAVHSMLSILISTSLPHSIQTRCRFSAAENLTPQEPFFQILSARLLLGMSLSSWCHVLTSGLCLPYA